LDYEYSALFAGTGKKVVFKQITPEVATQRLVSLGFPPAAAASIIDTLKFMDEFGRGFCRFFWDKISAHR
jgi:hypothetical protein